MNAETTLWVRDTAERATKTFLQGYFGFWFLMNGLGSTVAEVPHTDAFDTLFTVDNLKAGVVMLALSVATSIGSKPVGNPSTASTVR